MICEEFDNCKSNTCSLPDVFLGDPSSVELFEDAIDLIGRDSNAAIRNS
jgi:hypothetical protein